MLAVHVLVLALILLMLIGLALVMLTDSWDFYEGDNPSGPAPDASPDELTASPESECAFSDGSFSGSDIWELLKVSLTGGSLSAAKPIISCITKSGSLTQSDKVHVLNLVAILLVLYAVVTIDAVTIAMCIFNVASCVAVYGIMTKNPAVTTALKTSFLLTGAATALACGDDLPGCPASLVGLLIGEAIAHADPNLGAITAVGSYCQLYPGDCHHVLADVKRFVTIIPH